MALQNDFLPFATGVGANVLSQSAYAALSAISTGYQSGVAQSNALNKTWRQSSIMAAVLAQFIVNNSGQSALDDGTTATLLTNLQNAILALSQSQTGTAFPTGGTAPTYTLSPSPALQSYAPNQRFRVAFGANGTTGSNTLNISGLGAKNLVQYGPDGSLVPAVITNGLLSDVEYNGSSMVVLDPVSTGFASAPSIAASAASNALTLTLNPTALAFRSGVLGSGTTVPLSIGTALSLTVPSGATLGTANGVPAQLAVIVAYNGGTPVLCVANMAGGLNLDETTLISPTTISGSSNSASTIYSASAVSANSPFRVVGYISITEATAGTWATAPTLVQGAGGQAMAGMQTLGFGQAWQNVSASRAFGTTYYNTTGKPIAVSVGTQGGVGAATSVTLTIGGVTTAVSNIAAVSGAYSNPFVFGIVPPGASYSVAVGGSGSPSWIELR
ncbi:hypothetical protein LMG19089_02861 [Ralstonia edaphis]|uniref:hypothetical protein n=1 Tax=Ralstonia edaphi TaxID=3058599 RepID=UPI0028F694EA|nr:hypothetical protein [Ralstonia sp. LMG 6871]CAJ0701525.1 hypothetical protein LMG19089_02861 [Ralstonia sp. LMG 6871]